MHGGSVRGSFDWFEEPDACCECSADPYPVDWGDWTHRLISGGLAFVQDGPNLVK